MDTHQGLDMKKRPGQANGQCGAGEVWGGGLRRCQTRPPREGQAEGRGRRGRGLTSGRSQSRSGGVAGKEERGGWSSGWGQQDVLPPHPARAPQNERLFLIYFFKKSRSVPGGCSWGWGSAGRGKPGRVAPGHPPPCAHPLPLAAALAARVWTSGAEVKALSPRRPSGNFA